jgi:hypothetical protein
LAYQEWHCGRKIDHLKGMAVDEHGRDHGTGALNTSSQKENIPAFVKTADTPIRVRSAT